MFTGLMTGVSGVRGIIGEGMTPEVALLWAGGFGTWLKGGKVVISRDSRPSGEMLNLAVKAGLLSAGCDVDDAGIVPTPVGALAVEKRGAAGGIIITASHNPQQWNALKFVRSDGRMLTAQDFQELERIVVEGPLRSVPWNKLGTAFTWNDAELVYFESVLGIGLLDLAGIKKRKIKVALDCVNGAGSDTYQQLLKALGCDVVSIYCDKSGIFPRVPEPLPENISELCKTVVQNKCAVGFAVDPDGDRLAVVDETGTPLGEEPTLAVAVKAILELQPGPIVVNSLTSQIMDDVAAEFGVECHRTRVGEANVAARMIDVKAVTGGEGNGGIILPRIHTVRDAGIGMAIILNKLASTKKTIKQLRDELPHYTMYKETVPVGDAEPLELMDSLAGCYDHDQISRIDGVRITFEDGWVQARPSNTEPIFRVYSESKNPKSGKRMLDEMLEHLRRLAEENVLDE